MHFPTSDVNVRYNAVYIGNIVGKRVEFNRQLNVLLQKNKHAHLNAKYILKKKLYAIVWTSNMEIYQYELCSIYNHMV